MNRDEQLAALGRNRDGFDVLIVGGGATGAGIALDAAARGYRTALFERDDFGKGTSSRSTKLVHGGVRYLQYGQIGLVRDALRERSILLRNAPHLVRPLRFILPLYHRWERLYYATGLFLYDRLAGNHAGFNASHHLDTPRTHAAMPALRTKGLRGSWVYEDGQFDDARLLIDVLTAAAARGATILNYAPVVELLRDSAGRVSGAAVRDCESGRTLEVPARVVINAAGVFCDEVRSLLRGHEQPVVAPSQGAHVVLESAFLRSDHALLIPRTPDGRVLFLIPWQGRTLVGTTDTPIPRPVVEPRPLPEEIDFLLDTAGAYLTTPPRRSDVLSAWAGIRPLVRVSGSGATAALSRDHTILVDAAGLITVTGGKWTTYRLMAEDCLDRAAALGGLEPRPSMTKDIRIEAGACEDDRVLAAVRCEMARSVEDVLARRTRLLFLDARAAIEQAPAVAAVLARELARDAEWQRDQVTAFSELARGYLLP